MKIVSFIFLLLTSSAAGALPLSLNESCQISVDDFGPNFEGHSTEELARILKKSIGQKDEYENKEAHTDRIKRALKLLPLAVSEGNLCLLSEGIASSTKYDAENQVFWTTIFIKSFSSWFDGKEFHKDFLIFANQSNVKTSSYLGTNPFGVTVRVSKTERSATYVSFEGEKTSAAMKTVGVSERDEIYFAVPVAMTPDQARTVRGNLRVIYQYRLREPFLATYELVELPKLDWPYEKKEKQTLILGDLTGVSIFDGKTGKVLRTFPIANEPVESPYSLLPKK